MSREIIIRQVDAFTTTPLSGNPAGVVTRGGESLTDAQMQAVAREMNVAETAFLLPPTHLEADVRIRWFTPETEVPLCGHATVASFHAAAEEGSWGLTGDGVRTLRLECLSGVLPLEVTKRSGETPTIRMGLPDPTVEEWADPSKVVEALGIPKDGLARSMPAIRSGFFVLIPVRGLNVLRALRPDMAALREMKLGGGAGGVIVASIETIDPLSAIHIRMFAPAAGVEEDPVTGSAQAPVAGWFARIGFFDERKQTTEEGDPASREKATTGPLARFRKLNGGRYTYTAEQGDLIGRRGRMDVELSLEMEGGSTPGRSARARDVAIIGRAVTVLKGTLLVP
jgi:trans-2,3-dihydro-3-hydroxyanthranilate isomerase